MINFFSYQYFFFVLYVIELVEGKDEMRIEKNIKLKR